MTNLRSLLIEARDFVGKSRCSVGHSVSEVLDRAKPGTRHCLYCENQATLHEKLMLAIASATTAEPGCPECTRLRNDRDKAAAASPRPFWHECLHLIGWVRDANYVCRLCAPDEPRAESHIDAFLAMALPRIADLMQSDPDDSTPEGRELMLLADLADRYERQKYPEFSGRPVKPHRSGGGGPPAPERPIEILPRLTHVETRLVRAEAEILKLGPKALETDYMKQFPDPYIPGSPVNRGAEPT